jgi:hypothetical protein
MARGEGKDKVRIGKAQLQRVRDNPPEAPFGRRLSAKDRLKLSKAGTKNLLEGTMEVNRAKQDKLLKAKRVKNTIKKGK